MKACINCKTSLPDEAAFCNQCGTQQIASAETPVEKNANKCPRCGTLISQTGRVFCDSCGYPLLTETENTSAQKPVTPPADLAATAPERTVRATEPVKIVNKKTPICELPVRKIGVVLAAIVLLALLGIGGRFLLQKFPSRETKGAEVEACMPAEIPEDYEAANQIDLEGDLRRDSYFKSGEEYSIAENATFRIPAGQTLIIQPGARVRFGENSKIVVEGTLLACGKTNRRILFTADTEAGRPGFWNGIEFNNAKVGTQLGYATVEFAGKDNHAPIWVQGSNVQLEEINFSSNLWYPISLDPNSEPKFRGAFEVENGPSAWELRGGELTSTRLWDFNTTIVVNGVIKILEDARLTLPENSLIKFLPQSAFHIKGELNASGTTNHKIVLTSVNDGGEEGSPQPKSGDWIGIIWEGHKGSSKLANVEIRYAGGPASNERTYACIYLSDAAPTLESVSIQSCGSFSLSTDIQSTPVIKDLSLDSKDILNRWELRESSLEDVATYTLSSMQTTDGARLDPLVTGWLGVGENATLVIDPGTQLLFTNGNNSGLWSDGVLKINGTPQKPVVMTSWHDPASGGNGQPAPGDWGGLHINGGEAGETSVQNLSIRYAGATENTCLRLLGSSARIENTNIEHCAGYPISSDASAQPNFVNLRLTDNALGNLWEIRESDLVERSTWTWLPVSTADDQALVRRINGRILIDKEATLKLAPGLSLTFGSNGYLIVRGGIQANGTPEVPILLTSWRDSDINPIEAGAQPGDWPGVILDGQREGQVLENVNIRYAGNTGQGISCLILNNASPSINNVKIEYCSYYPISSDLNSNPGIGNISLADNQLGNAWALRGSTLSNGNTQQLKVIQQSGGGEAVSRLVTGRLTIDAGAKIEIGPGVVMRFAQGTGIVVRGSLLITASENDPSIMTSWRDPEYSNEGGVQAGDWTGLYLDEPQGAVSIDGLEIRYAGGGQGALTLNNAAPKLVHLTIRDSASYPISIDIQSTPQIGQVNLLDNIPANAIEVRGSTLSRSGEQTWGPVNLTNGDELVYLITGIIIIGENATLTIDPQAVVKFTEEGGVEVRGGLSVDQSIFTSFHDDEYGGNTDGAASGEFTWKGIRLLTQKPVKFIDFTLRFADTGLWIENSSPVLSNVKIESCSQAAISADLISTPQLETLTLTDNAINGLVLRATELPDGETHWIRLGNTDQVIRVLLDNLTIGPRSQLIIDEGVVIKFGPQAGITVEGQLTTAGSEGSSVIFTTLHDDDAGGNTDTQQSIPNRGAWIGLVVNPNKTNAQLSLAYSEIRYAANGIFLVNMPEWTYTNLIISNSQYFSISCDEISSFIIQNGNIHFLHNGSDPISCPTPGR